MNTDASNVEEINIHHIKECLLLSCVASFEDWYCFFRTWSFTLCKNDLDFTDRSVSVKVLESISSSTTINLSVCSANEPGVYKSPYSYFRHFLRIPLLKTKFYQHSILSNLMSKRPIEVSPFLDATQSTSSEVIDFQIWFLPDFLIQ